jgi:hypothetical protein
MDGQEIMGRAVKVDFAKENPERLQARAEAQAAAEAEASGESTESIADEEIPEF